MNGSTIKISGDLDENEIGGNLKPRGVRPYRGDVKTGDGG